MYQSSLTWDHIGRTLLASHLREAEAAMKKAFFLLILLSVLSDTLQAKDRRKPSQQIQAVELPADYSIDLQLATEGHAKMLGGDSPLLGTPLNQAGQEVFDRLIGASFASSLPYAWNLTLVNNTAVNAASNAGGRVYVHGGLARLLGSDRTLWAAVLSHEVSHTGLRHQVRLFLQARYIQEQIRYYRLRAAYGDNSANWVVLGLQIAGPIALRKLARDQEHEADREGMMMMARAGYHPDAVFALHHKLRILEGEQSKFGAFFSNHPRWATRDQRSARAYASALEEYNRLWPDPALSPGGPPPVVAFLGEPVVRENKQAKTAEVAVPLYCRNTVEPLTLVLHLTRKNQRVPSSAPAFSNSNGNLEIRQSSPCLDKDSAAPALLGVPGTALDGKARKVKGQIAVVGPNGSVLEMSKGFDLRVPKP